MCTGAVMFARDREKRRNKKHVERRKQIYTQNTNYKQEYITTSKEIHIKRNQKKKTNCRQRVA